MPRHFLDLSDFDKATLQALLDSALRLKRAGRSDDAPLAGKALAMIFENPSTRTRISFDVGMRQLGGETIMLSAAEMQLGRGETVADTARVMSRYVDAIMIRTPDPAKLTELAASGSIPVINGLTRFSHPCQVMADLLTLMERRGALGGATIAWIGSSTNVLTSWIHAAPIFGFRLAIATPSEFAPAAEVIDAACNKGADIRTSADAAAAAENADAVVTDTWVSMGDDDADRRRQLLQPYQVTTKLMAKAKPDAIFMHCLPAHRGEEVEAAVIDGPQSVVWDEAENRLHAQKAILLWSLGEVRS
jgi:ornithine carbamoyltransferase